ncbi:MAG: YkgJ family cysteine cluster protein [Acidobacteriota bacterium]
MLTDTLCTRCGLCCDGTLLGDVELTGPAEAARLELLGLTLDDDEAGVELLALPCTAARGTRCTIYADRPQCCRTFACRLLQQAEGGVVPVAIAVERIAAARAQVAHVKTLLARVERRPARLPLQERYADAVAGIAAGEWRGVGHRAALHAAMAALDLTIRTTFL